MSSQKIKTKQINKQTKYKTNKQQQQNMSLLGFLNMLSFFNINYIKQCKRGYTCISELALFCSFEILFIVCFVFWFAIFFRCWMLLKAVFFPNTTNVNCWRTCKNSSQCETMSFFFHPNCQFYISHNKKCHFKRRDDHQDLHNKNKHDWTMNNRGDSL